MHCTVVLLSFGQSDIKIMMKLNVDPTIPCKRLARLFLEDLRYPGEQDFTRKKKRNILVLKNLIIRYMRVHGTHARVEKPRFRAEGERSRVELPGFRCARVIRGFNTIYR